VMTRILLSLVSTAALAGCAQRMTNAQIIAAHQQCTAAGMTSRLLVAEGLIPGILEVYCWPKEEPQKGKL
jgi:hypothetical protein